MAALNARRAASDEGPPTLAAPPLRPVASRMGRRILGWAAALAAVVTVLQGVLAWHHTRAEFEQAVQEVAQIHLPPLAASVWDIDHDVLRRQIDSLVNSREIAMARLTTATGLVIQAGVPSALSQVRRFQVTQPDRPEVVTAELMIQADPRALIRELVYNVAPSLVACALLTLLILVQVRKVLREELEDPLRQLTDHVQALSPETLGRGVELRRMPGHVRDEIDLLADGFQALQDTLARHLQRGMRSLESQTAMMQELLDALPNPVFVKRADHIYIACNRAYEQAFGMDRRLLIGRTTLDLPYFSADTRQAFHDAEAALMAAGGRTQEEVSYRYADGSERTALRMRSAVRLADGSVGGLVGIIVDISDRKRQERNSALRRDIFELIANGTPLPSLFSAVVTGLQEVLESRVGLLFVDPQVAREARVGQVHAPAWPELAIALDPEPQWASALSALRVPLGEPPTPAHPLWPPVRQAAALPEPGLGWLEPLSTTSSAEFLGSLLLVRPARRPFDEIDRDLLVAMGRVIGVSIERARGAAQLERLRAEDAETRRQLKMTIDSMQEGFVRADMTDRTERVNLSLVRMLGYESQLEMLGLETKRFYARIEDWRTLVDELMRKGFVSRMRCQARRRDGSILWAEISAHQALGPDGRMVGIEGLVRDVSTQIAAEEALQAARDEARAAAEAKGSFLANMSHEIRTPMNAVIGLTELALRTELTRQQRGYLDKVRGAASGLLEIINDVLDAARIESGRLELESVAFDLSEVLDGALMLMTVQVEHKGLRLRVERAPGVPQRLVGDPLRVRQVLLNLISNACKFTERGEIVVGVEVAGSQPGGVRLRFTVRDPGIGMSAEQLQRLFEPFRQADGSTTRRFGGSGLGLSITRELVQMMGGDIAVSSAPGQGSTFTVELPFGDAAAAASADAQSEDAALTDGATARAVPRRHTALDASAMMALQGARVLLVEDNAINRQVAMELLTQAGIRVEVAADGSQALEHLSQAGPEAFDAVLMDLQMPVMDGYTATRHIRRDLGLRRLPVLALTASVMAQDRQRVLQAGMDDHIAKPIVPAELFSTLSRWIAPRGGGEPEAGAEAAATRASAAPAFAASSAPGVPVVSGTHGAEPVELPELPGVDLALALRQVGGRRALLARLLRDFLHDHADDALRVEQALAGGELAAARRLVHTLKSVAGTLGATALRQQALDLEALLGVGDGPATAQEVIPLRTALTPVVEGLRRWEAERARSERGHGESADSSAQPAAAPDAAHLRRKLQDIEHLLAEMDPEVVTAVQALLAAWPASPAAAWRLADEAARFDFDAAVETLQVLQQALAEPAAPALQEPG